MPDGSLALMRPTWLLRLAGLGVGRAGAPPIRGFRRPILFRVLVRAVEHIRTPDSPSLGDSSAGETQSSCTAGRTQNRWSGPWLSSFAFPTVYRFDGGK